MTLPRAVNIAVVKISTGKIIPTGIYHVAIAKGLINMGNENDLLPQRQEDILFFAFRYALGRRTGAVTMVVDELKSKWHRIGDSTKAQIKREILQYPQMYGTLGDQCDIEAWQEILDLPDH